MKNAITVLGFMFSFNVYAMFTETKFPEKAPKNLKCIAKKVFRVSYEKKEIVHSEVKLNKDASVEINNNNDKYLGINRGKKKITVKKECDVSNLHREDYKCSLFEMGGDNPGMWTLFYYGAKYPITLIRVGSSHVASPESITVVYECKAKENL